MGKKNNCGSYWEYLNLNFAPHYWTWQKYTEGWTAYDTRGWLKNGKKKNKTKNIEKSKKSKNW